MKKIKINTQLFKHLFFISIYLRLFSYPLSNIINALTNFGYSGTLSRIYDRLYIPQELILMVAMASIIVIIYFILVFLSMFLRYIRKFITSIRDKELWIVTIDSEQENKSDKNKDKNNVDPQQSIEQQEVDLREDDFLNKNLKMNINGLLFFYALSFIVNIIISLLLSIVR